MANRPTTNLQKRLAAHHRPNENNNIRDRLEALGQRSREVAAHTGFLTSYGHTSNGYKAAIRNIKSPLRGSVPSREFLSDENTKDDKEAFFKDVEYDHVEDVKEALRAHPEYINITDDDGLTPLAAAVQTGELDMIELLVEKGASVNKKLTEGAFKGFGPIDLAVEGHEDKIAKYLVDHGAKATEKTSGLLKKHPMKLPGFPPAAGGTRKTRAKRSRKTRR